MATVHLIHGYLCSGKTTFAKELEQRTNGVRFSLDEWMTALTWDPIHLDDDLYERLYALVMAFWPRIAERELDVILELGFWSRRRRDDARGAVVAAGHHARLYALSCPHDVARSRCAERSKQDGRGYRISVEAYDALRSKFEPLGPEEDAVVILCGERPPIAAEGRSRR